MFWENDKCTCIKNPGVPLEDARRLSSGSPPTLGSMGSRGSMGSCHMAHHGAEVLTWSGGGWAGWAWDRPRICAWTHAAHETHKGCFPFWRLPKFSVAVTWISFTVSLGGLQQCACIVYIYMGTDTFSYLHLHVHKLTMHVTCLFVYVSFMYIYVIYTHMRWDPQATPPSRATLDGAVLADAWAIAGRVVGAMGI